MRSLVAAPRFGLGCLRRRARRAGTSGGVLGVRRNCSSILFEHAVFLFLYTNILYISMKNKDTVEMNAYFS